MTLTDLQGDFSCFYLKISAAYFSGLWLSSGDLTKDDNTDDLWRLFSDTVIGFIVCRSNTQYIMYEANYNNCMLAVIFSCHIQLEGLLRNAECDVLAIAMFIVNQFYFLDKWMLLPIIYWA